MSAENKQRVLYIFKYLLDNTDEEHPATIKKIASYLESKGITAGRKTISDDLDEMETCGYDVVCTRSTQNLYFIGSRVLELSELKLLVDAVQAARFITPAKSRDLIKRICSLASPHQVNELKRKLYVDGKVSDGGVLITVNMIYTAIQTKQTMTFQYYDYTPEKQRIHRHNGQVYELSPYDLFWSNDRYYVLGYSHTHDAIRTFRVDRIDKAKLTGSRSMPKPKSYHIEDFRDSVFLMFDGKRQTVKLHCDNDMMNVIVDKFGKKTKTTVIDNQHFSATVEVSTGATFYSWVFNYAGKIRIQSPQEVKDEYKARITQVAGDL